MTPWQKSLQHRQELVAAFGTLKEFTTDLELHS